MTNPTGLYVHIPFCISKCPYCDFYSFDADESVKKQYVNAVLERMERYAQIYECKADTLYIGGGTPSVLDGSQIAKIVTKAKELFLTDNAEITVECNPQKNLGNFLSEAAFDGVNRVSFGFQSANENELKILGRKASPKDCENAVKSALSAGISNVSADVILGIPEQTALSLEHTLDFILTLGVKHISGYMLKIEDGTPFSAMKDKLNLPDEDSVCDLYELMCNKLTSRNTLQYEISNFAQKGFESRHNLKYWRCEEYLGIGAAAHSFINGKRFFFPRDINRFILGKEAIDDSDGGNEEEYIMLKLRLTEGIDFSEYEKRFSHPFPCDLIEKAKLLSKSGLININENGFSLTQKGFLLSNSVICEFI